MQHHSMYFQAQRENLMHSFIEYLISLIVGKDGLARL
jgi:hypothetical protein